MAEMSRVNTRPGIHLNESSVRSDPYPTYKLMREHYPVCQIEPDGIWAISRFKDVRFVLANHELFSSSAISALYESDWLNSKCRTDRLIIAQDPPEHDKYSVLVKKLFLDKATKYLIPLMRDTADSLLNKFYKKTHTDFMGEFAYPFVGTIVRDLMGIGKKQSLEELRHWVTLEGAVRPTRPDDDFIRDYEAAIIKQKKCFKEIIDDRRNTPRKDLVTYLLKSKVDGENLDDEQIIGLMCLLVQAGLFTTVHMLGHAVIMLSKQPEILSQLTASPELIPDFIEELLRLSPSVLGVIRMTTREVELSDIKIPKGALVMPLLASANRDGLQFFDPDKVDLHRSRINYHLAFGNSGSHTCIGAALARLEIKIVLEAILSRYSEIHCSGESQWIWEDSIFVRGVSKLPVSFR